MIASLQFASCVDRLGWVLVHSLWQFALLMLVALVLQRALQRCSAVTRYWALLATMCATIIAPVATWGLLLTDPPAAAGSGAPGQMATVTIELPAYRAEQGRGVVPPLLDSPYPELESLALRVEPPNITPTAHKAWLRDGWVKMQDSLRPWLSVIVCAWCAGVLAFAIRPLLGWYTVHRFRTVGVAPVPESVHSMLERLSQRLGLRHAAQILQSTLVQAPVVAGYFRPVILVPMSVISGLPVTQLEAILAHELAHVSPRRLPGQPAANAGGDGVLLPSGGVVAIAADSQRAGELLRRPGGRCAGQWRGLRSRAAGGGGVA